MKRTFTAFFMIITLLACGSLTGCQTSEMKEAKAGSQAEQNNSAAEQKLEKNEDEYIDEDYVNAKYDEDGDTDLDKYKSGKKSKSSKKKKSQQSGTNTADNGETAAQDQSSGWSGGTSGEEQDAYHTAPVPEGMPEPVEPQDSSVDTSQSLSCTLYVECSTILNNMDSLAEGKESLVPANGVIYGPSAVTFYEGESVYDVLLREMQNNRIHMEAEFTAANNSSYIKAINNLYERDCGNLSGWRYCVNGWYPNYGCSRYQVQNGDTLELHYTCDLGRDLDGDVPEGN